MDLSSLLTSRTVAMIGLVCLALSALAAFWALVKLSYQRALGRPMPRNALTGTLDVLAELAVNVVGAVSRALKLGTGESLFRPTVPLTPPEAARAAEAKEAPLDALAPRDVPRPINSQRGAVDLRSLALLACTLGAIVSAGLVCAGCPRLPPVSGCEPAAQTCLGDRPHVCSASQRWEVAGDLTCAAVGGVCAVTGGVAACVPAADAGAAGGDL